MNRNEIQNDVDVVTESLSKVISDPMRVKRLGCLIKAEAMLDNGAEDEITREEIYDAVRSYRNMLVDPLLQERMTKLFMMNEEDMLDELDEKGLIKTNASRYQEALKKEAITDDGDDESWVFGRRQSAVRELPIESRHYSSDNFVDELRVYDRAIERCEEDIKKMYALEKQVSKPISKLLKKIPLIGKRLVAKRDKIQFELNSTREKIFREIFLFANSIDDDSVMKIREILKNWDEKFNGWPEYRTYIPPRPERVVRVL